MSQQFVKKPLRQAILFMHKLLIACEYTYSYTHSYAHIFTDT